MIFKTNPVGAVVCAEDIGLYNHKRKIEITDIPELSKKWWEYWDKRDTKNKLPVDYTCEVTIPTK